ncbi:MAG: hypothetical protein OEL87_01615 [Nanoarchaeota archaeon]|nr:hypothetical protein [Nanoarchaeota archaeon]
MMKVELHYFLKDSSHQMDAVVRHRCEGEILKLISQIGYFLKIDPKPQTEAYSKGGLVEIWSFVFENQYLLGIISGVLISVISNLINVDRELANLQKESLTLEIQNKKLELHNKLKDIDSGSQELLEEIKEILFFILNKEYRVIRARSDFYKNLNKYPKVEKISGTQLSQNNQPIGEPTVVEREQFKKFILYTDDVPSEIDEDASIDVIAPVLKKGKYKWKGFYNGTPIDFYMKDKDFKESIFLKQISFTNGIKLKCVLEASRKMNEAGEIYISSYSVLAVVSYQFDDNLVETTQGRKYFLNKKSKSSQMKLFDE